VNERVTSHIPNASVSRSRSGPSAYRPRTSERSVYVTAAQRVGHAVLREQHARRDPGEVLQLQADPCRGAGDDAHRRDRALEREPVAVPARREQGTERDGGQQHADAQQVALIEH
jgi:hypothetical protein